MGYAKRLSKKLDSLFVYSEISLPISSLCSLFLLLPLVAVLLIKNGQFTKGYKSYRLAYSGSYGWLYFWSIFFFPIVILLLVLKGVDVIELSDEIIFYEK